MTQESKNVDISLAPGLLTVIFVVLALTGNCAVCGLDTDYMAAWGAAARGAK